MAVRNLPTVQILWVPEEEKTTIRVADEIDITTYAQGPVYLNGKLLDVDPENLGPLKQLVNRIRITETEDFDDPNYAAWMERYLLNLHSAIEKYTE